MEHLHQSIMVGEILEALEPKKGSIFIDGTLGDGGHTSALLSHGARVISIDQDIDAITRAFDRLKNDHPELHITTDMSDTKANCILVHKNFSALQEICDQLDIDSVNGILFDLGVSTLQLLEPKRGFSFVEGPLDMRMNKDLGVTAADLVNGLSEKELTSLFRALGDEPRAHVFAHRIIKARTGHLIATTKQLADIIANNTPRGRIHPATRIFQALRMAVNMERDVLEEVLPLAASLLADEGKLAVISFHSGEDGIVKRFIRDSYLKDLTKKPIEPSTSEVARNPRSRSAKLRIAQKI